MAIEDDTEAHLLENYFEGALLTVLVKDDELHNKIRKENKTIRILIMDLVPRHRCVFVCMYVCMRVCVCVCLRNVGV